MSETLVRPEHEPPAPEPPGPRPGARRGHDHGKVLPHYDGGGVAAEVVLDEELVSGRAPRLLVPSTRQAGGAVDGQALQRLPTAEELAARTEGDGAPAPPLRQRMREGLSFYNPFAIPGPKVPIVVFGLLAMLGTWDDQALGLIGPELRTEFGTTLTQLAFLSLISGWATQIMRLPVGYLVDRTKRVWLVRFSSIAINVVNIAKAMAGSFLQFQFLGWVGGVLGRFGDVADGPMIADYYPSRTLGRVYANIGMARSVGSIVGLLFVGWLVEAQGWRSAVFSLAVMATVVSVLTFLLKEPVRGAMTRQEFGASPEEAAIEQRPLGFVESFRAAWSIRTLRLNAVAQVVGAFTGPVTLVIATIEQERFLLGPQERSIVMVVLNLLGIVFMLALSPLSERFLHKRPATIIVFMTGVQLVTAAATVGAAFAPNLLLFYGPRLLAGALPMVLAPAYFMVAMLVLPPRVRGFGAQILVPFTMAGSLIGVQLTAMAERMPLQQSMVLFAPFYLLGAVLTLMTARTIGRDIRAARAAAMADRAVKEAREAGAELLLVARQIDVVYDGAQVLFAVDLDVRRGETLALVGTNGAGKSTLLRALCGLHMVDNGAILFEGDDVTATPPYELARRGMVYVPGGQAVFPNLTVEENLRAATWAEEDQRDVDARIEQVLTYFPRLRERYEQVAGSLSGGEQQMVALSQAFLMRPKLLLIDELSLGLAPAVVEQLLDILRAIRDEGTTLVLVEQSLNVAASIADRAVFLDKGRVEFDGPTDELLRRPDLVRSIFLGGTAAGAAVGRRVRLVEDDTGPILACEHVSVAFGGVHALDDVTVSVEPGEIVGVIGPNGAGKTTLFDVLSGYVRPDEGRVLLAGRDVTNLPPYARAKLGLGRSFQSARLFPALTVRETIAVALEKRAPKNPLAAAVWAPAHRQREARLRERVDGYIELLGLEAHADKFVSELSTGSRRAVDVACAMAYEPSVLLLDEPSSGLAQAEIEALGPTLARIAQDTGCALVIVEHDLSLITSIADRLVGMDLGRVLVSGPADLVTRDPQMVASYLNASETVLRRSGSRLAAFISALGVEAPTADGPRAGHDDDHDDHRNDREGS